MLTDWCGPTVYSAVVLERFTYSRNSGQPERATNGSESGLRGDCANPNLRQRISGEMS